MNERTILTWVDLETTGLDPKTGQILELAVVLTDLSLNELDVYHTIVPQTAPDTLALMDEYCRKMHNDNGLLKALIEAGDSIYQESLATIEQVILNRLERAGVNSSDKTVFVIAGSSVSFDKKWIEEHMPRLFDRLHYRQLDVSGYKVGFPEIFGTNTSNAHRALPDIRASIAHHKKMRDLVEDASRCW